MGIQAKGKLGFPLLSCGWHFGKAAGGHTRLGAGEAAGARGRRGSGRPGPGLQDTTVPTTMPTTMPWSIGPSEPPASTEGAPAATARTWLLVMLIPAALPGAWGAAALSVPPTLPTPHPQQPLTAPQTSLPTILGLPRAQTVGCAKPFHDVLTEISSWDNTSIPMCDSGFRASVCSTLS